MAELNIPAGTRLNICFAPAVGETPEFDMSASFFKTIDESFFLLSVPLKGGHPVKVDESQKLLLRYNLGSETMVIAAYCDDVVKQGIRNYWKLRRVSEQRQFFQRSDERYKVTFHVSYMQPTWAPREDGTIEKEDAMTLDISAGGAALFLNSRFDVGEVCQVTLPRIGTDPEGEEIENVVSAICWYRDAPQGSPYRFICGIQFRFANDPERDTVRSYVGNIKKVYKL